MKNLIFLFLIIFVVNFATAQNVILSNGEKAPAPLPIANGGTGATSQNFLDLTTPQIKNVGTTLNPTPLLLTGSINDFLQYDIKNTSTGTAAQSGFSASANNGTATTNFMWMGKNNTGFANPQLYNVGAANDGALLNDGGNLYIHNTGLTGRIGISTGNATTPFYAERLSVLNANGNVGIGTTTPTAKLQINGTLTTESAAAISNQTANFTITAAQVDAFSVIKIAQTTAGILLTSIAAPTSVVTGRFLRLHNTGAVAFTYLGDVITAGSFLDLQWNGVVWAKETAQAQSVDYVNVKRSSASTITNLFTIISPNTNNWNVVAPATAKIPLANSVINGNLAIDAATNNTITISKTAIYTGNFSCVVANSLGVVTHFGQVVKNGNTVIAVSSAANVTGSSVLSVNVPFTEPLVAGDVLDFRIGTATAGNIGVGSYTLDIAQKGSTATTSTTRVNVICRNKTAQSLVGTAWTNLTNWTEIQDPTNSFDPATGVFIAPRTGTYQFSTGNATPSVLFTNYVGQSILKNGTTQLYNFLIGAGSNAIQYVQTNGTIEMLVGETLQARTYNGGTTANDSPSASNSWFTVTEINPNY